MVMRSVTFSVVEKLNVYLFLIFCHHFKRYMIILPFLQANHSSAKAAGLPKVSKIALSKTITIFSSKFFVII